MLALVEALVVLAVVLITASVAYALIRAGGKPQVAAADSTARWVAMHYSAGNVTRVVVRKVRAEVGAVLDEQIIVEIPDSDSDFDAKFIEAMAQARARAALFESESDQ